MIHIVLSDSSVLILIKTNEALSLNSPFSFPLCVLTYHTVAGDLANIILDPIFMFVFHLGVRGAAIAHVISQ